MLDFLFGEKVTKVVEPTPPIWLYTEDEVKELIWRSQNLFLSEKYLKTATRNRKHTFRKWFDELKKK
jgi:hypothetical protein|tara:strand:- start:1489 stop:1689 length:201 start_codon:yes stop_codon:yes gene_type:complete